MRSIARRTSFVQRHRGGVLGSRSRWGRVGEWTTLLFLCGASTLRFPSSRPRFVRFPHPQVARYPFSSIRAWQGPAWHEGRCLWSHWVCSIHSPRPLIPLIHANVVHWRRTEDRFWAGALFTGTNQNLGRLEQERQEERVEWEKPSSWHAGQPNVWCEKAIGGNGAPTCIVHKGLGRMAYCRKRFQATFHAAATWNSRVAKRHFGHGCVGRVQLGQRALYVASPAVSSPTYIQTHLCCCQCIVYEHCDKLSYAALVFQAYLRVAKPARIVVLGPRKYTGRLQDD